MKLYDYLLVLFFQVCPSYPPVLVVPKSVDDETVIAAAGFRHGGRFPVLSYVHTSQEVSSRLSFDFHSNDSNLFYFIYLFLDQAVVIALYCVKVLTI